VKIKYPRVRIAAVVFPLFVAMISNAQLKGDHLLGDFGLSAGTQAQTTVIAAFAIILFLIVALSGGMFGKSIGGGGWVQLSWRLPVHRLANGR
jgi:hypothetical protein